MIYLSIDRRVTSSSVLIAFIHLNNQLIYVCAMM
nr:MAG TPA: hypothetical protein [Caudoviricetes sp.]